MKQFLYLVLICITLTACDKLPELQGFDKKAWEDDADGCKDTRLEMVDTLMAQKDKMKGLGQNQITELLGKADQHELYERSQKFFIYHLQAGSNCDNFSGNYFKAFYIRFNSLDQAVAFTIQEIK